LKPGAYFEQAEISVVPKSEDGSINGTYMDQWGPLALEGGVKFGKPFSIAEDSEQLIKKAGFVNVNYQTFKWPIGTWPKDLKLKRIGAYNRLAWQEGMEGWAMYLFTHHLGVRLLAKTTTSFYSLKYRLTRSYTVAERGSSSPAGWNSKRVARSKHTWLSNDVGISLSVLRVHTVGHILASLY
jgi:hypothetical protein